MVTSSLNLTWRQMESFIKISDEAQTGKVNVFLDLSLKCLLKVGNTVQMTTEAAQCKWPPPPVSSLVAGIKSPQTVVSAGKLEQADIYWNNIIEAESQTSAYYRPCSTESLLLKEAVTCIVLYIAAIKAMTLWLTLTFIWFNISTLLITKTLTSLQPFASGGM